VTTFSKDLEAALDDFMTSVDVDRDEAIRRILGDWLIGHGYLKQTEPAIDGDISETVQYPEFMDDASGGAGG
jgi:hypothetical protein